MDPWVGVVVILATVMFTVLVTVPWSCKRCSGDEEGNDDASV